ELVEHLRFVQRQVALAAADEDVAFEPPAFGLELLAGAEEAGIVGHVEHAEEPDPPRVLLGRAFFNKYRYPAIDRLGDVGVALGAEDWAGAGVGVEECQILRGEGEAALVVAEIFDVVGEEDELGRSAGRSGGAGER